MFFFCVIFVFVRIHLIVVVLCLHMLRPLCARFFFFLMIRRPPRSTLDRSSAASDVYKRQGYKSPIEYPELFLHTHQLDLVGPRYIKGDGRYYSVNILDISSHTCFVEAVRTKASKNILQAIASFWKIHGIPDALQMDNELAFRGSNRFPRSYGNVVRFALSLSLIHIKRCRREI